MSRLRMRLAAAGAAALAAALTTGAGGLAQAALGPAETVLPGSTVPFTSHTRSTGYVVGTRRLTIQLWLRPDVAAAQRYAIAAATPGSALFHHYLSPAAYTARFAAPRAAASGVESWLRGRGFTGIGTDAGRSYVRATAPVSVINAAFRTRLALYKATANAGRYPLRANNRPVSLPSTVAARVLGVTGLDNANPALPMVRDTAGPTAAEVRHANSSGCSQYYGQHKVTGLPEKYGTTTFPAVRGCGYSAGQLRIAYGATDAATGKGQTIALVELGLAKDMFPTLADYAKANHMPAPSGTRYRELSLGKNTCGDPFDVEEQADVESSYDMAPGANQLVVGGDSCNTGDQGLQGLFDAETTILNGASGHPLATIAVNPWEAGSGEAQPVSWDSIENGWLVRAAAEGVGMYFATNTGAGVWMPSSDPYAIAVGGTTLGIGASRNRLFETGYSTGIYTLAKHRWNLCNICGNEGAGGGPSMLWRQPAYQKGVVPPALATAPGSRGGAVRSTPDISALADPFTGMAVGLHPCLGSPAPYCQTAFGDTGLAASLVAGLVADAQQGQPAPFGFLNPVLYKLYGTDAYHRTLPLTGHSPALYRGEYLPELPPVTPLLTEFDDQNPNMPGYTGQVTLPGYDNMTGIGTPNGPDFIQHLRDLAK